MKHLICLLAIAVGASAQAVRVDPTFIYTTPGNTPPGANAPVFAVSGATIAICTDSACATLATTFTSASAGTPCPVNAQVTLPGSGLCRSTTGTLGQWGAWVTAGTYYFTVTSPQGVRVGPYAFTAGGTGGGGSSLWSGILPGTNTLGTFLVGTGSQFGPIGGGTVNANVLGGIALSSLSGIPAISGGTPVNATAASVINLFSGCSGILYLGADGACHSAGGNAITALTGDGTAAGPGSVPFLLATVNSDVGSCGDATHVCQTTINAKGLTTAATPILISGGGGASSVSGLTDLKFARTSATVITGGAGTCDATAVAAPVLTISAGTATAYIACDRATNAVVIHRGTITVTTCTNCTTDSGTGFLADNVEDPIGKWTVTSGTFDPSGWTDLRGLSGRGIRVAAGTGLGLVESGNLVTLSCTGCSGGLTAPSSSVTEFSPSGGTIATAFTFTIGAGVFDTPGARVRLHYWIETGAAGAGSIASLSLNSTSVFDSAMIGATTNSKLYSLDCDLYATASDNQKLTCNWGVPGNGDAPKKLTATQTSSSAITVNLRITNAASNGDMTGLNGLMTPINF